MDTEKKRHLWIDRPTQNDRLCGSDESEPLFTLDTSGAGITCPECKRLFDFVRSAAKHAVVIGGPQTDG
jgi:hypothetical protein